MSAAPRRKLIEVALPLDAINAASAREKSIRHGHPSTLHLWWARRPLAACRAVLFAQLVDDPSSRPEEFPTEADQDRERERLFGIIEQLVKWENSTNETVLEAARAEILKSTDGDPPPILDPFAGGGSIPLEAQRLGLEAHASDLNPVAVLINKALIEIPPRWADQPPVHPDAERRTHWRGAEGLAEDVRQYGKWMRDEAERRIGHLYPKAKLEDGSEATVIAWIWARTVTCPNPACGATMPLASSFWLGRKQGKEAWINPVVDHDKKTVRFEIGHGPQGPPKPPKVGRGARFRCLVCEEVAPEQHVRAEGVSRRMGAQLIAIAAQGHRQRIYLAADPRHTLAADVARPAVELADIPQNARWFSPPLFGMVRFEDIFTSRQLYMIDGLYGALAEVVSRIQLDAVRLGEATVEHEQYAWSIGLYLALALGKVADYGNSISSWASHPKQEAVRNAFSRQALPMVWDYAEANPFSSAAGSVEEAFKWVAKVLDRVPAAGVGLAEQRLVQDLVGEAAVATDPPYYDNIGYADLSDFFYSWLRPSLGARFPELFATAVAPRDGELIASPTRHGGSSVASARYFEDGFVQSFTRIREVQQNTAVPMTFFYAFKQSEKLEDEGWASTGWSTMLEGLMQAGWRVTGTWPMRTEMQNRVLAKGTNALASSVVLACRPRPAGAGVTDRRGLVRALRERLPGALHELQKAHIAPVDLRQAAIGPGMEVFSAYSRVLESDESSMSVRTALGLINQVLGEVLGEQEAEFDGDTRWAIQWFSQFFGDEGEYGVAEQLAVSMNVAVDGLRRSGIVESGGGKVRLLSRAEYPDAWDPLVDDRVPVWEACQHLVKRLEEQGEGAAGDLLARLEQRGGLGEAAQLLAYRLFTVCERTRPALAGPYNALIAAWPEIQRHARNQPAGAPAQQTAFDT